MWSSSEYLMNVTSFCGPGTGIYSNEQDWLIPSLTELKCRTSKIFSAQLEKHLSQKEHLSQVKSEDTPFPGKGCPAHKLGKSLRHHWPPSSACIRTLPKTKQKTPILTLTAFLVRRVESKCLRERVCLKPARLKSQLQSFTAVWG